jgi:hypothetical protein
MNWNRQRLSTRPDVQKAFDSPSNSVQKLGWYSRGVAAEFAEFLLELEEDRRTVVRTSYSAEIFH